MVNLGEIVCSDANSQGRSLSSLLPRGGGEAILSLVPQGEGTGRLPVLPIKVY